MRLIVRRYFTMLITVLAFPAIAAAQDALPIGSNLPMKDRAMATTDDGTATIASVKADNGTVVIFWCNTCPWVKRYEERFVDLASTYQAQGFGFIAVNPNDPVAYPGDNMAEMKKQAAAGAYTFPYVVDEGSELAVAFGAARTPQVYLFDSSDKLVYQGAIDDSPADAGKVELAYLKNALDAVVAGQAIAENETKAFGCTIKFQ